MKRLSFFALLSAAIAASASATQVADFEDVDLPAHGYLQTEPFLSRGFGFNNAYNAAWGTWAGFAASRVVDTTTSGFTNQYATYAGGGYSGSQYAVGYVDSFGGVLPTLTLPQGGFIQGVAVSNTTYAALSMRDGDAFAKKFGGATRNDPDFFLLTATGLSGSTTTGTAEFYLADYRFADNSQDYILKDWAWFDLSALGAATTVQFSLTSSDNGSFGMNTPAYFAIDSVAAVPEPATFLALGLGALLLKRRGNR